MFSNLIISRDDGTSPFDKTHKQLIFGKYLVENNKLYTIIFIESDLIRIYWERLDFFKDLNELNDIILINELRSGWELITKNIETKNKINDIFSRPSKKYCVSINNFQLLTQFFSKSDLKEGEDYEINNYSYQYHYNNERKNLYDIFFRDENLAIKYKLWITYYENIYDRKIKE